MSGDFYCIQYDLKGTNSLETAVNSSRENGTTFYESTLTLTLPKLTKEDHKELKLMAYGRLTSALKIEMETFLRIRA